MNRGFLRTIGTGKGAIKEPEIFIFFKGVLRALNCEESRFCHPTIQSNIQTIFEYSQGGL